MPDSDVHIHIPFFFWKHLLHTAGKVSNQPILLGGVITHLASKFGFQGEEDNVRRDFCLLTRDHLLYSKFISEGPRGSINYKVCPAPNAFHILPSVNLPPLLPNQEHYLFPDFIPDEFYGQAAAQQQQQPQNNPDFNDFITQQFALMNTNFTNMSQQIGAVNDNMTLMNTNLVNLNQRVDTLELDQRRALEPMYRYHYEQDHFTWNMPHPSWFQPPPPNWGEDDEMSDNIPGNGDD